MLTALSLFIVGLSLLSKGSGCIERVYLWARNTRFLARFLVLELLSEA